MGQSANESGSQVSTETVGKIGGREDQCVNGSVTVGIKTQIKMVKT